MLEDVTEVDGDKRKINAKTVKKWLKDNSTNPDFAAESEAIANYGRLLEQQSTLKGQIRTATNALYSAMAEKYSALTEHEIKVMVVEDKWLGNLENAIKAEIDRISQALAHRVKELTERYETPLPIMVNNAKDLEKKVNQHLEKMGFSWM